MQAFYFAVWFLVAAVTACDAQPYSLRGIMLGITLDEFRATSYPDQKKGEEVRVICTGDKEQRRALTGTDESLTVFGLNAKLGIRRCNFFRKLEGTVSFDFELLPLNVANVIAFQLYEFAPAIHNRNQYRLFRISIRTRSENWDQIFDAYRERFGFPTSIDHSVIQTRLGATFENTVADWKGTNSSIRLIKRFERIDSLRIYYALDSLIDDLKARGEAIEGRPSSKL